MQKVFVVWYAIVHVLTVFSRSYAENSVHRGLQVLDTPSSTESLVSSSELLHVEDLYAGRPSFDETGRNLETACGEDFSKSKEVVSLFNSSSSSWDECGIRLDRIVKKAEDVTNGFDSILSAVAEAQDSTGLVLNVSSTIHSLLKPVNAILSKIPKVGSIIDALYKLLDKLIDVADKANDKLGQALEYLSLMNDEAIKFVSKLRKMVEVSMFLSTSTKVAALTINKTIICSSSSSDCKDDRIVEESNALIAEPVNLLSVGSTACPRVFEQYDKFVDVVDDVLNNPVVKRIRDAVNEIEDLITTVRPPIEKAIDAAKKGYLKAYCCTASVATQFAINKVDDVMDFTSCATRTVEALANGAVEALITQVNALVTEVVMDQIDLDDVGLVMGSVSKGGGSIEGGCEGGHTGVATQKFSPLKDFFEAIKQKKLSPVQLGHEFWNIVKEASKICDDAAKNIVKAKWTGCCKEFVPLSDGTFCDPTGNVPFRRCTQCTSNTSSWSFKKWHVVCGKAPCGKDGSICGLGTTCNKCCSKKSSFWWKKGFTVCGNEPKWKDGEWCVPGLSCLACKNKATFWPSKGGFACGFKCWGKGSPCIGDLCNNCCKEAHTVIGKGKLCGVKPCLPNYTPCLADGVCETCCNKPGAGIPICGIKESLPDGTPCAGNLCKACKNGKSFEVALGARICGPGKCVPNGTPCWWTGACKKCCEPATKWDYHWGGLTCGEESCRPKNTPCSWQQCKACCSPTNNGPICGLTACLPKYTPCAGDICKACCTKTDKGPACGGCLPKGFPCVGVACKACCSPTKNSALCGYTACFPRGNPCKGDLCKGCCGGKTFSIGKLRFCGDRCKLTGEDCTIDNCKRVCCTGHYVKYKKPSTKWPFKLKIKRRCVL